MPECLALIGRIEPKLQQVFYTKNRVLISASTGTGFQEGSIRNCTDRKVLNCVSGAFSKRWYDVTKMNGKACEVLDFEWGQPVLPGPIVARLATGEFDAVTIVHNETSTGVINPIADISKAIRALPNGDEIMILVDSVSGLAGAEMRTDDWDLDVVFCSSQKAFALPPGIAFAAVSERAMRKAATVSGRGFYFDFITLAKYLDKNQTPATTAVSLLFALDMQLDDMLAEGMEARFARHLAMRDRTIEFVQGHGMELYGDLAYASPTVTNLRNNKNIDIPALNAFLRTRNMIISNGYGPLKGKAFRIAHMGDLQLADMEELFAAMDDYLAEAA